MPPKKDIAEAIAATKVEVDTNKALFNQELGQLEAALKKDPLDLAEIEINQDTVKDVYEEYTKSHKKLLNLYLQAKQVSEYEVQSKAGLEEAKKFKTHNIPALKLLQNVTPKPPPKSSTNEQRVKLPKRELPKFGGDVREWLSFWSSFEHIDQDTTLSDSDKLHYLIQSMVPDSESHNLIRNYPEHGIEYKKAVDRLKECFGSEKVLFKVYVRDLLRLVVENASGGEVDFGGLVQMLDSKIKSLDKMQITKTGEWIYAVVESCIPKDVLMTYLNKPGKKEDLDDLMAHLRNEVDNRRQWKLADDAFTVDTPKPVATVIDFVNSPTNAKPKCGFCNRQHGKPEECRIAKSWTLEKRQEALRNHNCCRWCALPNGSTYHKGRYCKTKLRCDICQKPHLTILCRNAETLQNRVPPKLKKNGTSEIRQLEPTEANTNPQQPNSQVGMANYIQKPEVVLQTLMINLHGRNGVRRVRAMFDSGSQSSCVLEHIAKKEGLEYKGMEKVVHHTFGGQKSEEQEHPIYKLRISALEGNQVYFFDVSGIKKISGVINSPPKGPWLDECVQRGIRISDVDNYNSEIEVLIGSDVGGKLKLDCQSIQLQEPGLIATETKVGWVLEGKLPRQNPPKHRNQAMMCINMHITDKDVSNLWSLDAIGIHEDAETKTRQQLEESALNHFKETVVQNSESHRYVVSLPWIEGHPELPDNRSIAFKRLESTTRNLQKDGKLKDYDDIFKTWEAESIIEKVPPKPTPKHVLADGKFHYLPHRAVYKENSTTPVRPVFDASARTKATPSLNDCLEKGPNLLELIPNIMTRFRMESVGVIADIKKAFLQMELREQDRDSLRFLWWDDINTPKQVVEYRHSRVVFGVSASPFLLGATLNHHLDSSETYQETAQKLKKSFYVDNCVASLPNIETAQRFKEESRQLLSKAGFDLRGWEIGPSETHKTVPVLGMLWETQSDTLQFDVNNLIRKIKPPTTKREILSFTNGIFDPLGLVSPITFVAKVILKEICGGPVKYNWDQLLPQEIIDRFRSWLNQVSQIGELKFPRCVLRNSPNPDDCELHVFCDASKLGYATCIFLRNQNGSLIEVNLLQGKARVAPKQIVTIPRLELLGCLIGSCLAKNLRESLDEEYRSLRMIYWTDSSTALQWISSETTWAPFVNNRVRRIRDKSDQNAWRHVPGELNPADIPSRGSTVKKLVELKWWEGPNWLYQPENEWPTSMPTANEEEVNTERRKTVVSHLNQTLSNPFKELIESTSDYHSLLRNLAHWHHYIAKLKIRCRNKEKGTLLKIMKFPMVSSLDIDNAEKTLFRSVQASMKTPPKLACKLDEDGILRVQTKLTASETTDFSYPILLPGNHPLTKLLIRKEHEIASHAGVQFMQGILREKYWITNNRRTIRNVIHSCTICKRYLVKKCETKDAALPPNRLRNSCAAFEVTGVDLAGPLFVKDGGKVWIVLFTCAMYRAVHLELVSSLSTEAFIGALRKFIARRGRPDVIYSDNGTNFVGTSNLLKSVEWNEVLRNASVQRIKWIFNPPTAAWWGGWWERLIGLMKQLLRRVLGNRSVKYSELEIILCEVENIMNERPLTYISEDPDDLKPLKPAMFLRDLPVSELPEIDIVDSRSLNLRLRLIQKLRCELRSRFRKEYLSQLVQKRHSETTPLKPDDIVLVEIDNKKRNLWPIGRIIEVYPSSDGQVRAVKVKTNQGEMTRPVQRLYPLEFADTPPKATQVSEELPTESDGIETESTAEDSTEEVEYDSDEVEPIIMTRCGRIVHKPDRFTP